MLFPYPDTDAAMQCVNSNESPPACRVTSALNKRQIKKIIKMAFGSRMTPQPAYEKRAYSREPHNDRKYGEH